MLGAYAALQGVLALQLPTAAAILLAMNVTAAVGWSLDRLILAPLRAGQAPHLAPMIATIGVAIISTSLVEGFFGAENLRFPSQTLSSGTVSFGSAQITGLELKIILLAILLMVLLFWGLTKTRVGIAVRAVAESPKAAALLGVNVEGLFGMTSIVAAMLAGVAGVLVALYSNAVFPRMGQPMLHKGIAVVILGGMGDIRGALIGGFFLGFAEVFSVAYVGSTMRDAISFGLLFAILLLRPQGLFGNATQRQA
jgi:branched-chain amino acid transport system permease protein